jgi:hypothetical protein
MLFSTWLACFGISQCAYKLYQTENLRFDQILAYSRRNVTKGMEKEHLDVVTPNDSPQNSPMEWYCVSNENSCNRMNVILRNLGKH